MINTENKYKKLDYTTKKKLYEFLSSYINIARKKKFEEIIKYRTKYISIVLEDIFQPHNASAVLRTAECFGIQNIHIIENKNTYKVNPDVALGAEKWINIFKYNSFENNTSGCLTQLKQEGYKIVATSPYKKGYTLNELPLDTPLAIIFGNELNGLSNIAIQQSDDFLQIPMFGFTESFNISVSVAIIISHLIEKLHSSSYNWQLNEEEKIDILIQWVKNTIKKPQLLEENFLKTYNK